MKLTRYINEPIRIDLTTSERWHDTDKGLIACWECGRKWSQEKPELADRARRGELIPLPWKGGVSRAVKSGQKIGTFNYLAMWQGLRGNNLDLDTHCEPSLRCSKYDVVVIFTADSTKYADA